MSFAEAQYTVDSLLSKLKTGEASGIPPRPIVLPQTTSIGVNWYDMTSSYIRLLDSNKMDYHMPYDLIDLSIVPFLGIDFGLANRPSNIVSTIVSGKTLANVSNIRGEIMRVSQVINKEIRPGDGIYAFEISVNEFLEPNTMLIIPNINKYGVNITLAYEELKLNHPEAAMAPNGIGTESNQLALKLYTKSDQGVYCYDPNHYIKYRNIYGGVEEPDPDPELPDPGDLPVE